MIEGWRCFNGKIGFTVMNRLIRRTSSARFSGGQTGLVENIDEPQRR
jgi:hypothetical protein